LPLEPFHCAGLALELHGICTKQPNFTYAKFLLAVHAKMHFM